MRVGLVAAILVLALGVASARADAVVPVEGSWAGESSAGLPVHFGVADGHVVNTRFKFSWGFCGTFESHAPYADVGVDPADHWVFEDPRGQTFEGTFVAPNRVEGKIISLGRMLPSCPRTEAIFTAAPVPPNPESFPAAREGVEALPYDIDISGVESQSALIGKVRGDLGEKFVFYLFVNRKAPRRLGGAPEFDLRDLKGGKLANTDELWSTTPRRGWSRAQKRERCRILRAVGNTVCRRQTRTTCASS
ncbi:MAG TPA: hypothetical protein VNN15_06905 [Solirubrobacterales bacterium]|nr:hypothetical protein [Solirubrobacterales bacterium]